MAGRQNPPPSRQASPRKPNDAPPGSVHQPVVLHDRRTGDIGPPPGVTERRKARPSTALKPACPHCGSSNSTVERSYGASDPEGRFAPSEAYYRWRRCEECRQRFPTKEVVDLRLFNRFLAREGKFYDAASGTIMALKP